MSQAQAIHTRPDQFGRGTWTPMAGWWSRVAARLIDDVIQVIGMLPYFIGLVMLIGAQGSGANIYPTADPTRQADRVTVYTGLGLMGLGGILGMVIWVWNRVLQQGRTGQSIGKAAMGIVLVSSSTGRPVGAASVFIREVTHIVDSILYVGYLWPLWDRRKQTLADKVLGTVVAQEIRTAQADEPTWAQRALR